MNAHEIDYKILGDDMQCVEVELDPQETTIAEAGSLIEKNSPRLCLGVNRKV